jgi:hypothetical protein
LLQEPGPNRSRSGEDASDGHRSTLGAAATTAEPSTGEFGSLDAKHRDFTENHWTAAMWECGFASRVGKFALWSSLAHPVLHSGQLVWSLQDGVQREGAGGATPFTAAAARLYLGRNSLKASSELSFRAARGESAALAALLGGEIRIGSALWVDAAAGIELARGMRTNSRSRLVLKLGSPR